MENNQKHLFFRVLHHNTEEMHSEYRQIVLKSDEPPIYTPFENEEVNSDSENMFSSSEWTGLRRPFFSLSRFD
jgi:hypothetical protein